MKPAVLMMFRDEADILGKCLEHWYALGVRDFYLCDNGSKDDSAVIAQGLPNAYSACGVNVFFIQDNATDWPGRRVINDLKERALNDGCDWLFPAEAYEFLQLPEGHTLESWIGQYPTTSAWGELPYLNILPNKIGYWQEPQKKACGYISNDMMISMGNHLIEGVKPTLGMGNAYYNHYTVRSYEQFKRKMENYMITFHQSPHKEHPHAQAYNAWDIEGEQYIRNRYDAMMKTDYELTATIWEK